MSKFIEIHETIINVEDIRRVEFISDDIYLGLFKNIGGEIVIDYTNFEFANIYTLDGQVFSLCIDIYLPEEDEDEEIWRRTNMAYINMTMQTLRDVLQPVKVTDKEYEFC